MASEDAPAPPPLACGEGPGWSRLRLGEPVVVLTCARSGSTLLRFILDSHPELACPPETGIVDLCTRMGVLSMLLDGPGAGARPGLSSPAAAAIRSWITTTFGTYLVSAGKSRWCDKSLGSAESASRFLELFPETKFICLYRHCLDVIDSALEACPFGLRGYGMDPYVAAHPGNSVGTVADYWVAQTRAIAEFERAHPDACLRLRYEDLVADPEGQANRVFTFLGERPVPGIAASCLPTGQDPFGPGDHKVWATSSITPDSVGRGARIPAELISPPIAALVNHLLRELGYSPLGSGDANPEARDAPDAQGVLGARTPPPSAGAGDFTALDELEELLAARLTEAGPTTGQASSSFLLAATLPADVTGMPVGRWWRVDPAAASMTPGGARPPEVGPGEWMVAGGAQTWRSILSGEMNLGTAFRQGHLKCSGALDRPGDTPYPLRGDIHTGVLIRLLSPPRAAGPPLPPRPPLPDLATVS